MTERDDHLEDERAPLVLPDHTDGNDVVSETAPNGHEEFDNGKLAGELTQSKSSFYMFMLTLSIGG